MQRLEVVNNGFFGGAFPEGKFTQEDRDYATKAMRPMSGAMTAGFVLLAGGLAAPGASLVASNSIKSMFYTTLYEQGASLITQGNLGNVDGVDIAISGIPGLGFWGGLIFGSLVDGTPDKGVSDVFSFTGNSKSWESATLDAGVGAFFKGIHFSGTKVADGLSGAADNYIKATSKLKIKPSIANTSPLYNRNANWIMNNYKHKANNLEYASNLLRKTATGILKTGIPLSQKKLNNSIDE